MTFLALSAHDVERVLPMAECIDVMADALLALEEGDMVQPLRSSFVTPGGAGVMSWMPARRKDDKAAFGMKVLCVIHGNPARGLNAHQGAVLIMDGITGEMRGMLDASTVTAIRTAAVSGVATRLLARDDAAELTIIGTGVQAERHLEAIPLVRPITRVRVVGRTPERARAFVERVARHVPFSVEAAESAADAVRAADIVVTATSAAEPVLQGAWLREGTHVNAVGASQPVRRELDTAVVARASLFTDRRESLEREAGEYQLALKEGVIGAEHLKGELGQVLAEKVAGRTSASEITLFRSLGLASEDVAAAQFALAKAQELGIGAQVPF